MDELQGARVYMLEEVVDFGFATVAENSGCFKIAKDVRGKDIISYL